MGVCPLVHGLPCIDHVDQMCDGCLVGPWIFVRKYHTDHPRRECFLFIFNNFNRYMWSVLLKIKNHALQAFKIIKVVPEVEFDEKSKGKGAKCSSHMNSRIFAKGMR